MNQTYLNIINIRGAFMRNRFISIVSVLLISIVFIISLSGCSSQVATTSPAAAESSTQAQPVTLNVSAASSLTRAITEISSLYMQNNPNVTITLNCAGSGTLQKQIEQGAPTDVFISAAPAQMNALQNENLIDNSTRKNILTNTLVMVVPNDSTLGLSSFQDLTSDKVSKIAIADPKSVPAGSYAQKAFDELGLTAQLTPKYVIGASAEAALSYAESGNVEAGLVYLSEAKTSTKIKVVANAPDDINAQIVYPAAVIKATKAADAANKFENYLMNSEAKAIFEKYGFTVVP